MKFHIPVLEAELIENLNITPGNKYIDCTLGDGGHTLDILAKGGVVLGLDINENSLGRSTKRISDAGFAKQFTGVLGNFKDLEKLAIANDFKKVSGVIYDLGYSSTQLDQDELGLSFLRNEPLDMRLDKNYGVTAADLVNALGEPQLAKIFFELGGENMSRKFARAIIKHRDLKKFRTTKDLADLLASEASPGYEHGRIHPATRAFQALRIVVNNELENLKLSLPQAAHLLLPGGRMEVITFHSLEDRLVKEFGHSVRPQVKEVNRKPIEPTEAEVEKNNRSRSAKLRVFEHIY